mgnify:CR=1 FL=1
MQVFYTILFNFFYIFDIIEEGDKMKKEKNLESTKSFYKVTKETFHVNGLLYYYDNNNFQRLPNSLNFETGVQLMQTHPAGAYIDFTTNSSSIGVRVKLAGKSYMAHMTATGTIGLDLYVKVDNKYTFIGTTKIDQAEFTYEFFCGISKTYKEYRLYLPLYIELYELELILDKDAKIRQDTKDTKLPKIVVYGTSISQGGCATRSGMCYPSIMGRMLPEYEIFNLGFSGNAHLHYEIANLISDIVDLEILILEVEANAGEVPLILEERLEKFIQIIKEKKPDLKIYLISHFPYTYTLFKPIVKAKLLKHKIFQKEVCEKWNVEFLDGEELLKELNYEETVDLIHLTDLGFYHLAKELVKIISKKI